MTLPSRISPLTRFTKGRPFTSGCLGEAFTANGFDTQGNPDNDGDIDNTVTVSASGPDGPLPSQTASARVEIETWATGALQISTTRGDSSPDAATGLPDTLGCSDSPATAWTPEIDDSPASGLPPQTVILQVNFAPANFHATGIEIHESFETGSVVLIELLDENGVGIGDPTHQVYSSAVDGGPDPEDSTACPGVFRITFPQTPYAVSSAWIYTERPGFEQIDAVRLIGVTVTP